MQRKIIEREVNSEYMLYNAERGDIAVLNPAAKLIYTLSMQNLGIDEIATALHAQFAVKEDQDLKADIQACIDELKEKEWL